VAEDAGFAVPYAAERLASYKRPGDYRIVAESPAAATGKVLKHKLRDAP
jgi:acyl-CoA synthetase (AMP-forming)/AMP-acid ligase II